MPFDNDYHLRKQSAHEKKSDLKASIAGRMQDTRIGETVYGRRITIKQIRVRHSTKDNESPCSEDLIRWQRRRFLHFGTAAGLTYYQQEV
jgi:hypothetical protein